MAKQKNRWEDRKALVAQVARKLGERKNIALVGLPGIGKDDVAARAAVRVQAEHDGEDEPLVLVRMNLSSEMSADGFLRHIATEAARLMTAQGLELDPLMEEELDYFAQYPSDRDLPDYSILRNHLDGFLEGLDASGVWMLVIIEEFDTAIDLFGGKRYYYEFLRQRPANYNISYLLLSRQLVKRIETNAYGNSTLFGIFEQIQVREYDAEDMAAYRRWLQENGVALTKDGAQELARVAGRNPHLLALLGDELAAWQGDSLEAVQRAEEQRSTDIVSYFDGLTKHMKRDKTLPTVLRMILGPWYRRDHEMENLIREMGYLPQTGDSEHAQIVSEAFADYLRTFRLEQDPWDEVTITTRALREMIEHTLPVMLGHDPSMAPERFNAMLDEQDGMWWKNSYGKAVKNTWYTFHRHVTYLSASGVNVWKDRILRPFWEGSHGYAAVFHTISFDDWNEDFTLLHNARLAPAHQNAEFLTEQVIRKTNLACERIQKALGVWEKDGQYYLGCMGDLPLFSGKRA